MHQDIPIIYAVALADHMAARLERSLAAAVPAAVFQTIPPGASLARVFQTVAPDLVVITPGTGMSDWRSQVGRVRAAAPDACVVLLVDGDTLPAPEELARAGVDDWFSLDEAPAGRLSLIAARARRRSAAARNRALLERADQVMTACRVGVWELDIGTLGVSGSESLTATLGYPPGGLPVVGTDLLFPDDALTFRTQLDDLLRGAREELLLEHQARRADGRVIWLASRGRLAARDGDPSRRVVGVSLDVTELEHMRDALRVATERYRVIAELAAEVIVVYDSQWRVEWANASASRVLGYSLAELRGMDIQALVQPESHERLWQSVTRRLAGEPGRLIHAARRKDGATVWIESSGVAVQDEAGRLLRHIVVGSDVTERMAREQQLEEALASREALLREIHHRVRNSFQIVLSLLNLQTQAISDPAQRAWATDAILRLDTVSQLHALLCQADDVAWANAATYLQRIVDTLRGAYAERSRAVQVRLDVASVGFCSDHGMRVGLIVNELVSNAFKHAFPDGRHGSVLVRLQPDGTQVRLEVSDDGVGLPGLDRPCDGLGLALVGDLVRQLAGTIEVERGHGTRVVMQFDADRVLL
ncbi:MAG: PAS domain S-box protein [Vicinamibacterales bacterium]